MEPNTQPTDRPADAWSYYENTKGEYVINNNGIEILTVGFGIEAKMICKRFNDLNRLETETAALRDELERAKKQSPSNTNDGYRYFAEGCNVVCYGGKQKHRSHIVATCENQYQAEIVVKRFSELQAENERLRSGVSAEELEKFIAWLDSGLWSNEEHHPGGEIVKTPLWYNTPRYDLCKNPKTMEQLIAAFRGREGK